MSDSQPAHPAAEKPEPDEPTHDANQPSPGRPACASSSLEGRGGVDDPEIEALLDFEPVPRKRKAEQPWTPELQREFIARLAVTGSPGRSSEEMGKTETGVRKLYRSPEAASFRAAWHEAVELAKRRKTERMIAEQVIPGTRAPSLDSRRKWRVPMAGPLPGQIPNEHGEYEFEGSIMQRVEDARDRNTKRLLSARRLYLMEICGCPGKRAAFEILTELPIDWKKAKKGEPQPDEPFRRPRMREPDMLLTAENGWLPEMVHGPDKKAELRKDVDEYLAKKGMEPVDWTAIND